MKQSITTTTCTIFDVQSHINKHSDPKLYHPKAVCMWYICLLPCWKALIIHNDDNNECCIKLYRWINQLSSPLGPIFDVQSHIIKHGDPKLYHQKAVWVWYICLTPCWKALIIHNDSKTRTPV